MPGSIDEVLNRAEAEHARRRRVGPASQAIFMSLRNSLGERVTKINETQRRLTHREPWTPVAVRIKDFPFDTASCGMWIEKTTDPKASLTIEFPINAGELTCTLPSEEVDTIRLDFKNGTPEFRLNGKLSSSDDLAERWLLRLLGEEERTPNKRPIGF